MAEVSASTSAVALTFQFPAYQLRTVMRDGEPWFIAADVCEALDIGNNRQAVARLDDDEKGVTTTDTPSGEQQMTIINESGLYSLILTSRKPEAKKFKKWVTSEVLPTIRKTGHYEQAATSADAGMLDDTLLELTQQHEQLQAAQAQVQNLQARLLQSQARQLRLMGSVIGLQKRWNTREARDTIIRMERQGAARSAIIAASGRTSNHVRQVVFQARAAGELPALDAAPAAQAALFEGA